MVYKNIKIVPQFNCIFSSVYNSLQIMGIDLDMLSIYLYGDGFSSIYYNRNSFFYGTKSQYQTIIDGLRVYGLDMCFTNRFNSNDIETILKKEKDIISSGSPIIVPLDTDELTYSNYYENNLPIDHAVILTEIDLENQSAYIIDSYIPTNPVTVYQDQISLKTIVNSRLNHNMESYYIIPGCIQEPKISPKNKFLDSISEYSIKISDKGSNGKLYTYLIQDFQERMNNLLSDEIAEFVYNFVFNIKRNGVLTYREMLSRYLVNAQKCTKIRGYEELINLNKSIINAWEDIEVALVRWKLTKNKKQIEYCVSLIKKISDMDREFTEWLLEICHNELNYT